MFKNELTQIYGRLAGHILDSTKNRDLINTFANPEKVLNESLQIIMHRLLIQALIKFHGLQDVGSFDSNGSVFANQAADALQIDGGLISEIKGSLAEAEGRDSFVYAHELLKGQFYHPDNRNPSKKERKKEGVYYTPSEIVNYILDNTLNPLIALWETEINRAGPGELAGLKEKFRSFRLLDPSCGSGVFLAAAANRLMTVYKNYNQKAISCKQDELAIDEPALFIACHNLCGVDRDSLAAGFTRFHLTAVLAGGCQVLAEKLYQAFCQTIVAGDFLEFALSGEFCDVIVGNPPYVANRTLDKGTKHLVKQNYSCAVGQYDLIVPFIEGSLNLLKPGGSMGFILPNKYLAADYGYSLRELLTEKFILEKIVDVSSVKVFRDAAVYPVIQFVKRPGGLPVENSVFLCRHAGTGSIKECENTGISVPQQFFRQLKYIIPPDLNGNNRPIIEKMLSSGIFIDAKQISCGIAKSGFARSILSPDFYHRLSEGEKSNYKRILQVNNISPYKVDGKLQYISKDAATSKQWANFAGAKLLIPGIAKKLMAAVDKEDSALGRVYYIREGTVEQDIYFLLGLFNSTAARFFYRIIFWPVHLEGGYLRFNGTYLAYIPLPKRDGEQEARVAKMARELADGYPEKERIEEIDALTAAMYGLDESEILYMRKYLMEETNGSA